jgi:hypothetical protein
MPDLASEQNRRYLLWNMLAVSADHSMLRPAHFATCSSWGARDIYTDARADAKPCTGGRCGDPDAAAHRKSLPGRIVRHKPT